MKRRGGNHEFVVGQEKAMDAAKRETAWARLEARRQSLQRKLARVERQLIQVEQGVMATQRRIVALTAGQRKAA
jgi:hypothetical protein